MGLQTVSILSAEARKAYSLARELDSLLCRLLADLTEGRLAPAEGTQHLIAFWERRVTSHDLFLASLAKAVSQKPKAAGYRLGVTEARFSVRKLDLHPGKFKSGFGVELCRFVQGTHAFFSYLEAGTSLGFLPLEEFVSAKKSYAEYWENLRADLTKFHKFLNGEVRDD